MAQNSIEWLFNQIEEKGDAWENASIRRVQISIDTTEYLMLKQQVKKMHKQEIMDAWYNGFEENRPYVDHSEDYYNEKFNNNKNGNNNNNNI